MFHYGICKSAYPKLNLNSKQEPQQARTTQPKTRGIFILPHRFNYISNKSTRGKWAWAEVGAELQRSLQLMLSPRWIFLLLIEIWQARNSWEQAIDLWAHCRAPQVLFETTKIPLLSAMVLMPKQSDDVAITILDIRFAYPFDKGNWCLCVLLLAWSCKELTATAFIQLGIQTVSESCRTFT